MGCWNRETTLDEYQGYLNTIWTLVNNNVAMLVHSLGQTYHTVRCQQWTKQGVGYMGAFCTDVTIVL